MSDDPAIPPAEPENDNPQPANPPGGLDDLRASMAEEEQARLKKKNSGLLKKVTGLLRRQTSPLEAEPPRAAEPASESPFTEGLEEADALSDEGAQAGGVFSGWQEGEPVETADEAHGETSAALIWDGNEWEAAETEPPAQTAAAFDVSEAEMLAANEPGAQEQPAAPSAFELYTIPEDLEPAEAEEPAGGTPHAEQLRAELMPDAESAAAPVKKTTRGLVQRFTGWLNPDAVPPEAPEEVADEMIADRLQKAQSPDSLPEIPGTRRFNDYDEIAAAAEPGAEEEVDPFARLGAARNETEDDLREPRLRRESSLPADWVDRQVEFAAEEPIAEDYARKLAPPVRDESAFKTASRLSEVSTPGSLDEDQPVIEDVRSEVLDGYEETPAVMVAPPPEPLPARARAWVRNHRGLLIGILLLAVVVMVLAAVKPWQRPPITLPATPIPSEAPYPVGLEMTGGWFYDIQRSTILNNQWQPQGAEWLDGSQVRRVVALPWNRQSEAVVQTLARGDQINLVFSNNDLMPFLVRSVQRLEKSDTALFSENKPGLVIFLYGEESEQRWVVLALPK